MLERIEQRQQVEHARRQLRLVEQRLPRQRRAFGRFDQPEQAQEAVLAERPPAGLELGVEPRLDRRIALLGKQGAAEHQLRGAARDAASQLSALARDFPRSQS